jgi:polyhydroxybutyrate depolymerase
VLTAVYLYDLKLKMPRKILFIVFVLTVVTACGRPLRGRLTQTPSQPSPAGSSTFDATLTSSGLTRHYLLHVPPSYSPSNPVPLVINFHGLNSNSQQQENLTGMSLKADREGFLVVYPDGLNGQWNTGSGTAGRTDQQFIRDLIVTLEGQYNIDPKRIYATGISNGGGMTNRLGCDLADVIASIAPDSGAYNFWQDCNPSRSVPVLAFHGLDDRVIPYEGGTPKIMVPPIEEWASSWAKRNGCSATPQTTTPVETVTVHIWSGCQDGAEVILYTLANHGHSWPGSAVMPASITSQAINATDVIWEFFKTHPMP